MDPWLKLKFPKLHEIRIWTFLFVFSASKCLLSPRVVIVITKVVYFEISFIVTKGLILFEVSNYGPMDKIEVSKASPS